MNQLQVIRRILLIFLQIRTFLCQFKQNITGQTSDDGTKGDDIMVPLKHLSNFWRTR